MTSQTGSQVEKTHWRRDWRCTVITAITVIIITAAGGGKRSAGLPGFLPPPEAVMPGRESRLVTPPAGSFFRIFQRLRLIPACRGSCILACSPQKSQANH